MVFRPLLVVLAVASTASLAGCWEQTTLPSHTTADRNADSRREDTPAERSNDAADDSGGSQSIGGRGGGGKSLDEGKR